MDKPSELNYHELIELKGELEYRIKQFAPIRIKKKWKRCGKESCYCSPGPSDGSWGNLHGPYLFAQFVDHHSGKMRLVSLGSFYDEADVTEAQNQILDFSSYFQVSPIEYEKMSNVQKNKHNQYYTLTGYRFEEFYGVSEQEDTLGRHTRYYGTAASAEAFNAAEREISDIREAAYHRWARDFGLASVKGQRTLKGLLQENYYLVWV